MGSGKSTLGRALHQATGIEVTDLDDLIEERAGCSIRQYWKEHGEAAFRKLEEETLRMVAQSPRDMIVACGGGTPCFGQNMEIMNRYGRTVWLCASHAVLLSRLLQGREQRPLIAGMTDSELSRYIAAELSRREPHYAKALHRFDSGRLENLQQIRESVDLFIKEFYQS